MKILWTLLLFCSCYVQAQTLVSHAYGKPTQPAIIFLHGGPGSNAINFEVTTAQKLADEGFYVITYDRRGEGRSEDPQAGYNFQQTYDDLHKLYKQYHLQKAALIGFSFGGVVATGFADKFPAEVSALVLVSALVDIQATYSTIIRAAKDTTGLAAMQLLDRRSYEFRSQCFKVASRNGFFATPHRTPAAVAIYKVLEADTLYQHYAALNNTTPSYAFWKHEHYSGINNLPVLHKIKKKGVPVFAIYGKDDGLYSPEQVSAIQQIAGEKHLLYLPDAAHYLYNDQQALFLQGMRSFLLP